MGNKAVRLQAYLNIERSVKLNLIADRSGTLWLKEMGSYLNSERFREQTFKFVRLVS
jgi:hypothetical protein